MDFLSILVKETPRSSTKYTVYPNFTVGSTKDIMFRGKTFYAIWDESKKLWSTDQFDVVKLIDAELDNFVNTSKKFSEEDRETGKISKLYLSSYSSGSWERFKKYEKLMPNSYKPLDSSITFLNTETKKESYVSKRLPYDMQKGSIDSYDRLMSVLYDEENRKKIEWAIGSIIAGDSKHIQKFLVFYGDAGTGKSTVLHIVEMLFEGYVASFEAKDLASRNNAFAMEIFNTNPLVAIQHDGDLSRVEDNTKINSIVSHESMVMNEKYKSPYSMQINSFLMMATNKPVMITDSYSGLLRRMIDVNPTGNKLSFMEYHNCINQIKFELGAIAYHCYNVYKNLGESYYDTYKPFDMMFKTNHIYNFVEFMYGEGYLDEEDSIPLKDAYNLYKMYCSESGIDYVMAQYKFREELRTYFREFTPRIMKDGERKRSIYSGFIKERFIGVKDYDVVESKVSSVDELKKQKSILDDILAEQPAQYATEEGTPGQAWAIVETKLSDLNTNELHYVKLPSNHIVIDFDLKSDDSGEKSLEKNLEAAKTYPPTYAELSKSGAGLHLHYIYDGDISLLANTISDNIEIKTFKGNSALRRKLTKCNKLPIATITSGLPIKEEKKLLDPKVIKSEKGLRRLIERNLRKEIHPGTKPSMDFIKKILDDAYAAGYPYDVTDMRPDIMVFANNSTHHSEYCIGLINEMKFQSEKESEEYIPEDDEFVSDEKKHDTIIFYDIEVFPNLFIVCWKKKGKNNQVVKMINPSASDVAELCKFKLIGFNNRRYDNHILYARMLGYDNLALFDVSRRLIDKESSYNGFREAYNLSYADIYEYASEKKGLKKWEIELGIHHQELGLPWDQEVPRDKWDLAADYCCNDVIATEAVFEARKQDYIARCVLSELSGLPVNSTTQTHTAKIIFGDDQNPQRVFNYPDLSELFPGYKFDHGKSIYRGEEVGEGGYVYSEPGIYENVVLLDVQSMHPTSLINMNMFGPYTKNFKALKDARIAIKEKNFDKAKKMLGGIFTKYLESEEQAKDLSYALKIVINMVYGFTSAKFENKFHDSRNVDNKVAKRGALFMIELKHEVQKQGYKVVSIRTDSIKIPNADKHIIDFVIKFGKQYGYEFEQEATYVKYCLINKADYIARYSDGTWTATGDRFSQPYLFKTIFSKEKIKLEDLCEVKNVTKGDIYLDFNENLPEDQHNYQFVGRVGEFCPVKPGCGGGILYRVNEDKYYAVTGTKGYRWKESEVIRQLDLADEIDISYYEKECEDAIKEINKVGDFVFLMS